MERLARALRSRGHEPTVVTGTFEPRPRVEVRERVQDGVRVITIHRADLFFDRWEKTYCPDVSEAFARILERVRPDVVHVHHFIRLSRDPIHRAARAGVPAVLTLHDFTTTCLIGFRAPGAGASFCDLLPAAADCIPCAGTVASSVPLADAAEFDLLRDDLANELRLARARLALSGSQRERLARFHGIAESEFEVVRLGPTCDLPRGMPAPEAPPLRVATWGIQMERKGAHVAIEAVRRCAPGSVELDVYGRFDDPRHEHRCRDLARGSPIRFHGRFEWDEVAARPLHAALFPSLTFETFGLTIDEARALGHPVIATDLGAYRERADGATRLFPAGDVEALTRILSSLASDPAELTALRSAVRAPEEFGRYVDEMLRIYERSIRAGPPPASADRFDDARHPSSEQFARREEAFRRRLSGA